MRRLENSRACSDSCHFRGENSVPFPAVMHHVITRSRSNNLRLTNLINSCSCTAARFTGLKTSNGGTHHYSTSSATTNSVSQLESPTNTKSSFSQRHQLVNALNPAQTTSGSSSSGNKNKSRNKNRKQKNKSRQQIGNTTRAMDNLLNSAIIHGKPPRDLSASQAPALDPRKRRKPLQTINNNDEEQSSSITEILASSSNRTTRSGPFSRTNKGSQRLRVSPRPARALRVNWGQH